MTGTPRWAKVMWIIVAVVLTLFVLALVLPIEHGPGMHR
jgi:hypothetical protein